MICTKRLNAPDEKIYTLLARIQPESVVLLPVIFFLVKVFNSCLIPDADTELQKLWGTVVDFSCHWDLTALEIDLQISLLLRTNQS